ncbi:hypothetical protein QYE76_049232 [Lolium multiflorum]|uniref:Transposase (putative) gypsy type domain-containing protein n=1 Tax=Lolium multiflorum TaxID=4521 RepID=A0AAD8WI65_LOLMU|nr:hypothetical protein QYE76_049232 [Lolium multiflorum]
MVKQKGSAATVGVASSSTVAKATSDATKRVKSEVSAVVPKDAPGDWPASTMTMCDEKKARSIGLISLEEGNVILPGLSQPSHEFLRRLLHMYGIQLWQLTPNSILHLAIFITLCEAFLGIDPHWGLWKKIFFVKCYNSSSGSFITGRVGFVVRKEANYFNFPMRESVQGWRFKWFYLKDSSAANMCLPKFVDVLEAAPKKS